MPDANLDASAARAKGREGSGSCKVGWERKRDFNVEKALSWRVFHCQGVFFLMRSINGRATLE